MSRPPAIPDRDVRIRRARRDIERLKRRGPERWVYVGTWPGDSYTTPDSPPWLNGWTHALGLYDRVAFRWDEHWRLEFKGHATGGTSGANAFILPAEFEIPKDVSFLTDVTTTGVPKAAQIFITAATRAVKITLLA